MKNIVFPRVPRNDNSRGYELYDPTCLYKLEIFCFQHGSENKSFDFWGVLSVDDKEIGRDAPG